MIPDHVIDKYLTTVFGNSKPGDDLHHLLVVTGRPGERAPLGLPDPAGLSVLAYGLLPTADVDPLRFASAAIRKAIQQAKDSDAVIYFAALTLECHAVTFDGNELTENLARRLKADGKLEDHPHAVEVTRLYAACRDGRRWTGEHLLSGDGAKRGPTMRFGALLPREHGEHERLIRAAVGLHQP